MHEEYRNLSHFVESYADEIYYHNSNQNSLMNEEEWINIIRLYADVEKSQNCYRTISEIDFVLEHDNPIQAFLQKKFRYILRDENHAREWLNMIKKILINELVNRSN